jgi:hypothetical protein
MRNLMLSVLSVLVLATAAHGAETQLLKDTPQFKTCREQSLAKADAYVQDYVVPATDEDTAPPGAYVAIVYGHKFLAPIHPPANGDKQLHGLGEVVAKRAKVYREEMRSCLGIVEFNLLQKQQIFIFD